MRESLGERFSILEGVSGKQTRTGRPERGRGLHPRRRDAPLHAAPDGHRGRRGRAPAATRIPLRGPPAACAGDPRAFEERWRAVARRWNFDRVNELIAQHNEYYPIERRLPIDLRTGDYLTVSGRSYRRDPLGCGVGARQSALPANASAPLARPGAQAFARVLGCLLGGLAALGLIALARRQRPSSRLPCACRGRPWRGPPARMPATAGRSPRCAAPSAPSCRHRPFGPRRPRRAPCSCAVPWTAARLVQVRCPAWSSRSPHLISRSRRLIADAAR